MSDQSNEVKQLKTRIEELEKNLSESETKASESKNLAREIALSAVHHIRAVEEECAELYGILEELQDITLKGYVRKIQFLELDLKQAKEREEEAIKANIEIAKSAAEHVKELMDKIAQYERTLVKNDDDLSNSSRRMTVASERDTFQDGGFNKSMVGISFSRPVNVVKQGYLLKRSPAMFKGWQTRYFVLTDDIKLAWYSKEVDYRLHKNERGYVFLKDIPRDSIAENITCENEMLKIIVNGKAYELNCTKPEVAKDWWHSLIQECSR